MSDIKSTIGMKWEHRSGCTYLPLCYYPQGNPESGYWSDIVWCGDVKPSRRQAWRQGVARNGCDDFNIAVVRGRSVVAWLWDSEVVDDDPDFLAGITDKLIEAGAL